MLLLSDETDLAEVLLACAEHRLDSVPIKTKNGFAVSVVLASEGYPGSYPKGRSIQIGELPAGESSAAAVWITSQLFSFAIGAFAFHAGTAIKDGKLVTSGGRVLVVSAQASTIEEALRIAYAGVDKISFEGKTFRRDIAHRHVLSPVHVLP